MNTTWFTSDLQLHFGHENILGYCSRPWDDLSAMEQGLVDNFNACVEPDDVVYFVGDFAMGVRADNVPVAARLNGNKILIPGNHDNVWKGNKSWEKWASLYGEYFWVEHGDVLLTLGGIDFELSHFPFIGNDHTGEERYNSSKIDKFSPINNGQFLICGHIHDAWQKRNKMFNVGVDSNNYFPVHQDEIVEWARSF